MGVEGTLAGIAAIFQESGLADALGASPLSALAVLFGAGLVTSLTPCVYPMIPITAGIWPGPPDQRQAGGGPSP